MNYSRVRILSAIVLVIVIIMNIVRCVSRSHDHTIGVPTTSPSIQTAPNNSDGLNRSQNHLVLTKHAKCRMDCRHITEEEIKEILHDGSINYNKSQLHDARGPKYAVEGFSHEHQHLRVIFAPEPNAMVVVTCIDLDTEWECPSCN